MKYEIPYKCPVCNGQGKVQVPPGIAGDQSTYVAAEVRLYDCRACKGTGILWREYGEEQKTNEKKDN